MHLDEDQDEKFRDWLCLPKQWLIITIDSISSEL
jgi:hypothetical protein